MEHSLLLFPVESNTTDPTESSTEKGNNNKNIANVEVCNLVSNSGKNQNGRAHTNTGIRDYTRSKNMENQQRTLQQEGLTELELTAKTCWLIAVCGFLRASGIHRVDNGRTEISNNSIKLIICAPKEKRKSSPIVRLVEIIAHSNKILCPVIACPKPHVSNKNLIVSHLFRNTKDFSKPLTVDSISKKIKSIAVIAVKNQKGITRKARAIGATIAARTGISTDAILTQANWSSYYMFSSYYKLSNDSYSNIKFHPTHPRIITAAPAAAFLRNEVEGKNSNTRARNWFSTNELEKAHRK
ncbi:hypothetical protein BB561_003738 [Smittium simulii]|uniref:Uncharacterized protein n=1 Tax=Smittium simulii TaxID=133385 RepID=A0A2T9YJS8_9FUNG|nr:hypothetical protein BB561_003738 [Smittium simulii]